MIFEKTFKVQKKQLFPDFIVKRREILRQKALTQGISALLTLSEFGVHAVIFGSVLKSGEFQEGSDIDICIISQQTESDMFFSIAESSIKDFTADVSWFEDLRPAIKEAVLKEGKSVTDLQSCL